MPNSSLNEEGTILIELKPSNMRGTEEVSISAENIRQRSEEALDNAISSIKHLTEKLQDTLATIDPVRRPNELTIEFGLKLTTDANAFVVNAGVEGHFTVKIKWVRDSEKSSGPAQTG